MNNFFFFIFRVFLVVVVVVLVVNVVTSDSVVDKTVIVEESRSVFLFTFVYILTCVNFFGEQEIVCAFFAT